MGIGPLVWSVFLSVGGGYTKHLFQGSDLDRRYEDRSSKITHQDDIAAFASPSQRQLPAIRRPFKVENLVPSQSA